jgi:hypothetical protein
LKSFFPQQRFLYFAASLGFMILVSGVALGLLVAGKASILGAVILQTLGASILFPIIVSVTYDRLRERWLGDEVWRLFNELSDAGISRIYKDRENSANLDNAQTRLSNEFRDFENGEVLMMGVSLRVFLNPLGPFYRDIETMLRNGQGRVRIRALICDPKNADIPVRAAIEETGREHAHKPQIERDIESSVVTAGALNSSIGDYIRLSFYMSAPYCTTIIFPHVCYYAPNLLAPRAPAGLPMILFRSGSHGYKMIRASFEYLWERPETTQVLQSRFYVGSLLAPVE